VSPPEDIIKMPCSICKIAGHYAKTCPQKKIVPVSNVVPKCELCGDPHELSACPVVLAEKQRREEARIAQEKEKQEQDARAAAARAATEAAIARSKIINKALASDDGDSQSSRRIRPDPVLNWLFTRMWDTRSTLEWLMLGDYFESNPEMFRVIGDSHESNGDGQPHLTFEVAHEMTRTKNKFTLTKRYHIYYSQDSFRGKRYDFVSQVDRDGKQYVLAAWNE